MDKATKRPWRISIEEFKNIRIVADGYIKVNLPLYVNKQVDEETKANAELIVRAVNCHDELVKLLEESHERFLLNDRPTEEQKDLEVRINKALRRARGE